MTRLDDWMKRKLEERSSQGQLRTLKTFDGAHQIDFFSNDYLGLSRSAELRQEITAYCHDHNVLNGSRGSRLLAGQSTLFEETEEELARIFKGEAALIFNNGYAANVGVLSAVLSRNSIVLYDEYCHASIKDGIRLGFADKISFRHNDLEDLEKILRRISKPAFIVTESVFSMHGDVTPLHALTKLAHTYRASLILDEAHTTGLIGPKGEGMACLLGLHTLTPIRIYTFGKAMGIHGACVVGSRHLIQYLINFSRPFIYSTALSPHGVASIRVAFSFLEKNNHLQNRLQENIDSFCKLASVQGIPANPSAIQAVPFTHTAQSRAMEKKLQEKGIQVRAIFPPTVPPGQERLRIILHAYNTTDEISLLMNTIADA